MAIPLVNVTGTVYRGGTPSNGGEIRVSLSAPGSVSDGANDQVVGGSFVVPIDAAGAVDFDVIPNDAITPAGSVYSAEYVMPDGVRWRKTWTIATSPSSQELGDL